MKVLIDTHFLLWAALGPDELEPWARALLSDLDAEVLVSAVSLYEIGIKVRNGKLPQGVAFDADLIGNVERLGFAVLPLTPEVMVRAARFASKHKDPFDRMIAAQAIEFDLELLSIDGRMDAFGVRRLRKPTQP